LKVVGNCLFHPVVEFTALYRTLSLQLSISMNSFSFFYYSCTASDDEDEAKLSHWQLAEEIVFPSICKGHQA